MVTALSSVYGKLVHLLMVLLNVEGFDAKVLAQVFVLQPQSEMAATPVSGTPCNIYTVYICN